MGTVTQEAGRFVASPRLKVLISEGVREVMKAVQML